MPRRDGRAALGGDRPAVPAVRPFRPAAPYPEPVGDAPITIVIADDHTLVREGTRQLLERHPDLQVVGEVARGDEVPALVGSLRPDVLLLDVRLPGANGIEVLRRVATATPGIRVVMLSAFADTDYVSAALSAGAAGYLLKTSPGEEVAQAIRAVHAGATVLDPAVSRELVTHPARAEPTDLSPREAELVALVVEGLPNKVIATRLGISRRTVEGHLGRVFSKLGVATRTELARYAVTHGLVGDGTGP